MSIDEMQAEVPQIADELNAEFGYDPRWTDPKPSDKVLMNGMVRRPSWWQRVFGGKRAS